MSLISAYHDVIIPDLENMVGGVSDNGTKKVIVFKTGRWGLTASRHDIPYVYE